VEFENDLFGRSLVDWPQMKRGFDDVIARYPDAWNLNNFARFSCLARDRAKTRALLDRIGADIVPKAWQPEGLLRQCADWSTPPRPRRRRDVDAG
jgi:hypothetical protein